MKFWMLCSTVLFFLGLMAFARRVQAHNLPFAAYLALSIALQLLFAVSKGMGFFKRLPLDGLGLVAGALLVAAAVVAFLGRQSAVNGIIWDGLLAMAILGLMAEIAEKVHNLPHGAQVLVNNISLIVPTGYMLVRFSFTDSDWLPLLAGRISDFKFQIADAATAAAGLARSLLS